MNPQDSETTPLQSDAGGSADAKSDWTSRDVKFVFGGTLCICAIVMGTYYWAPLLAAFEDDKQLGWSKWDTVRITTMTGFAETSGLLVAGPMSDYLPGQRLLAFEAVVVCVSITCVSLSAGAALVTALITTVCFVKGLMWPAIGSLIAANLSRYKQDVGFLVTALGSRAADITGALLLSILMTALHCSWRRAVLILTIDIMVLVFAAWGVSPSNVAEPRDPSTYSLQGQLMKGANLLSSLDGWLAIIVLCGTYSVWAFYAYLSVILADLYHITPSEAAGFTACFPMGAAIGLGTAVLASSLLGLRAGRLVHLFQVFLGVCALFTLTCLRDVHLSRALVLHATVGFGFVVPCYLPYLIYAAASPRSERGFRLAVLDGLSSILGVGLNYLFGRMRSEGTVQAVPKLLAITTCGLLTCLIAMTCMYWRADKRDQAERAARDEDTD